MALLLVELLGGLNLLLLFNGSPLFCVGSGEVDSLGCVLEVDVDSLA